MAFTEVLLFCLSPAPLDTGAKMPPAGLWTAHKRREAAGGHRKHGQKKTRPRKAQGGRWRYSRFFRRLPDNHDRKSQNKQDNQAGVTSSPQKKSPGEKSVPAYVSNISQSGTISLALVILHSWRTRRKFLVSAGQGRLLLARQAGCGSSRIL